MALHMIFVALKPIMTRLFTFTAPDSSSTFSAVHLIV